VDTIFDGFRASELRGLQWQDVNFDACTINLQRGVVGKHVGATKTAESRHLVPISTELAAVLTQLRAASAYNQPEAWVLASTDKQGKCSLWLDTLMERKIRPAVAAAKIAKRVTWHVFRHSYATPQKHAPSLLFVPCPSIFRIPKRYCWFLAMCLQSLAVPQ
jgi:integrase